MFPAANTANMVYDLYITIDVDAVSSCFLFVCFLIYNIVTICVYYFLFFT